MRCFTYSDGKLELGIRFHDINGIKVGTQPLRFDDSLIFNSGCHFGQYIVNAVAQPSPDDGKAAVLCAPPSGGNDIAAGSLLLVRIPVRADTTIYARPITDFARVVHGGERVQRLFYRGKARGLWSVWEALIEFTGPGEFVLKEEILRTLSRMEKLTGVDPGFPRARKVSVCFDGERFSSMVEQAEGCNPTVEVTSLGMYDEGKTISLIAEMIGNQDGL